MPRGIYKRKKKHDPATPKTTTLDRAVAYNKAEAARRYKAKLEGDRLTTITVAVEQRNYAKLINVLMRFPEVVQVVIDRPRQQPPE